MNFCFSVCEYDPLHNGHVYHISQMKNTECDAVVVVMSGNFTQRGEIALMDKYTRARHAILAGADIVLELPTIFATAPAELFASGAIKTISVFGKDNKLCFGSEKGTRDQFNAIASAMINESKDFKEALRRELDKGVPFAQARANAIKQTTEGINAELLDNPNSILGIEYARANLLQCAGLELMPIERVGAGYKDANLKAQFCSASAIRQAISALKPKKIKKFVPSFVYDDLPKTAPNISQALIYSLLEKDSSGLRDIIDCTEGLENRFKVIARSAKDYENLIDRLETKRYTRARLSRVALSSMLGIKRAFIEKCIKSNLYVKVLAIEKSKVDLLGELSAKLDGKKTKLITRKSDADTLSGIADECFKMDVFANDIFNLASGIKTNEYDMKIVERIK